MSWSAFAAIPDRRALASRQLELGSFPKIDSMLTRQLTESVHTATGKVQ